MLEHSAMYLNVTPPFEDDASLFPDFYTRVGSCELQDPVWAKMNALTGHKQKRKKSDNKPQTQINKCNNEKRRREQENVYIEELAELISANFADMSSLSVKPDKCAILQETVNQIRRIKDTSQQTVDPVQQGEVSSSRPTILSNEVYGPLLLEALEGFLFVINSEGKVEHVTENVSNYIKYTKDEIIGKSIYNFMHLGDHTKFHSNLLPMTIEWDADVPTTARSKSIDVRLLVKGEDIEETVEEKNQRAPYYELMHISSTQLKDHLSVFEEDGSDSGPCLLCVASRISHRDKASCFFEQFTTKLDTSGKIICVDTSGVSEAVAQVLRKDFKGRILRDLVPQQDVHKVNAHLKETLSTGTNISAVYHIQVTPDKIVSVQTKSKLFKTNPHSNSDSDFIMATHSIIGDNDTLDPGGGIGGPLMTSVVNGAGPPTRNGPASAPDPTPPSSSATTMVHASPASGAFAPEYLDTDFLDFPHSTWDLEPGWSDTRPSSRQSVTPVSTPGPRPPSNPSYSNAPSVVQSPIAHYSAQPSPAPQQQMNQNSNFLSFGMPEEYQDQQVFAVEEKDKQNAMEESVPVSRSEPEKLRSLLTKPQTSTVDDNRDRILKELLNQPDEDHGNVRNNARHLSRPLVGLQKTGPTSSTGNNMLRELLNEPKDDNDIEAKVGMKKSSELLEQLLKKDSDDDDEKKTENGTEEDIFKSLGFPKDCVERGVKRPNEDQDDNNRYGKRCNNGTSVSSSGTAEKSEIYKKNQMLASLLETPAATVKKLPPIPASVISAVPYDSLRDTIKKTSRVQTTPGRAPIYLTPNNNHPFQRGMGFTNKTTSTLENIWIENNNDPDLDDILNQVMDIVPDVNIQHLLNSDENQPHNSAQLSETAAIKNIEISLMEFGNTVPSPNVSLPARPPAYSANVTTQSHLGYPPPNYPNQIKYTRPLARGTVQYANLSQQQQMLFEQQRKLQQRQAEEQRQRLLQLQKQQHLVIPSNVTEINSSIQNIDSLLNNTVAPNVTLSRSNSVPESQLSPGYGNQLQGSNSLPPSQRSNQQPPYSPHSQLPSPLGPQSFQQPQNTASNFNQQRLSPQSQFNSQLSPRQNYPPNGTSANNWPQQQPRLTVQNPMLNAQLTRPSGQQQRNLNSPGGGSRRSPFSGDQFAPPSSPQGGAFSQNQYLARLQRANSVPTTSSPMTGSPRPYQPPHYPPNPLPPSNPMMYANQDSYSWNEAPPQQPIYERRSSGPAPHLQAGVAGTNPTSEFVRQELRAVVGARTAQSQPSGQRSGMTAAAQQLQQQLGQGTVDLEGLGINFEMPSGASESPKLWAAMGSDMGSMSPQQPTTRTTMEEGRPGDHNKPSLLQKLLSDSK